jgi:hypothetical protein
VEGGIYTAVSGRGLTMGEWNIEVDVKVLHILISIYSFPVCEKCNITSLGSLPACKIPFSIQVPTKYSRTAIFVI